LKDIYKRQTQKQCVKMRTGAYGGIIQQHIYTWAKLCYVTLHFPVFSADF